MSGAPSIKVRPTAVLIEDGCILLLEQRVSEERSWSLPGGTLEVGETVEECLIREMREETELAVSVGRLLYVCERIENETHVIHMTFLVKREEGRVACGAEPEVGAQAIKSVKLVPIAELSRYGFGARFCELASAGFPEGGTYQGSVRSIGL
jgi:ADP-ribose pyrophosphatase YjhB (NUDIX family)